MNSKVLFEVAGRPVVRGDVLYHRDLPRTGGRVTAEFVAEGNWVTVRTQNGAVPKVRVSDLSWSPHPEDVLRLVCAEQAHQERSEVVSDRDFRFWLRGRENAAASAQDVLDAKRFRKLCALLQQAYDGAEVEPDGLTLYCSMQSGRGNQCLVGAELRWADQRDAPLDLGAVLDKVTL